MLKQIKFLVKNLESKNNIFNLEIWEDLIMEYLPKIIQKSKTKKNTGFSY